MEKFGAVLRHYREQAHLSQLALSKSCGIHASIINRFERDERHPADRDTIERLAKALQLTPGACDHLLAVAGFFPVAIERIGAADPDLLLVANILADDALPASDRDDFRQLLRIVARRWRSIPRPG